MKVRALSFAATALVLSLGPAAAAAKDGRGALARGDRVVVVETRTPYDGKSGTVVKLGRGQRALVRISRPGRLDRHRWTAKRHLRRSASPRRRRRPPATGPQAARPSPPAPEAQPVAPSPPAPAMPGTGPEPGPIPAPSPPSAGCTRTVATAGAIAQALAAAGDADVICVAEGSYGPLTISAARTGWVTLRGQGRVSFADLNFGAAASYVSVERVTVPNTIDVAQGRAHHLRVADSDVAGFDLRPGTTDIVLEHNKIHGGYFGVVLSGSRYPVPGGCCQTSNQPLIERVRIEGNLFDGQFGQDAMQLKGFDDVVIRGNELRGLRSNGEHNDGVQTVHGGSRLVIEENWFHDNNMQPLFIKDGLVDHVRIENNIIVRNGGPDRVSTQLWSADHLTVRRNTLWGPGHQVLVGHDPAQHAGGNPALAVPQGALVTLNLIGGPDLGLSKQGSFPWTETRNVVGTWTWMTIGPLDLESDNPTTLFVDPAHDDWRGRPVTVAGQTFTPGPDWRPADRHYGPRP